MNIIYLLAEWTGLDIAIAAIYGILSLLLGILLGYSINSKYKKQIQTYEQDNVKLKSSVSNLEAQLEETKKARVNADDEITLLRNRVRDRDIRIREAEGKMALVSKRLEDSQAEITALKTKEQPVVVAKSIEKKVETPKVSKITTEIKSPTKPIFEAKPKKEVKEKKAAKKKGRPAGSKNKKSKASSSTVELKKKESVKKSTSKSKVEGKSKSETKPTGKKRGRPPGSKNKATTAAKTTKVTKATAEVKDAPKAKRGRPKKITAATTTITAESKRRGRPPGSKNKVTKIASPVKDAPKAKRGRPAGSTKKVTPTTTRRRGRPAGSVNKPKEVKRGRTRDDLTLIEGIGPKIEEALRNGGIKTFNKIAATKPEKLKSILLKANTRFGIAATDSWPTQAKLAAKGAMEELKAYQDTLDRGR